MGVTNRSILSMASQCLLKISRRIAKGYVIFAEEGAKCLLN